MLNKLSRKDALTMLLSFSPICAKFLEPFADNLFISWLTEKCNLFLVLLGVSTEKLLENSLTIKIVFWIGVLILWVVLQAYNEKKENKPEFREKNYAEKKQAFCKTLEQRLERLNRETDWNESLFTPIEAEIEMCINGKQKKRFNDLLKCLKHMRGKKHMFLVLGDPGSGKSVALRKLCLDLLRKCGKNDPVPVYLNLKQWSVNWTLEKLPEKKDLIQFIRQSLYNDGDFFTDQFLDSYFDLMLENGQWFFVLDSFDEMPCLMGKKSCAELIERISALFQEFLMGSNQNGGILASRLYKSPSESLNANVTLTIQSLTLEKIHTMLKKHLNNSKEVAAQLFGKREDLVALCSNPFYLTLLIHYIQDRGLVFPENQMALYQHFVTQRLGKCSGKLEEAGLSVEDVHTAAKKLACLMQESSDYGFECPVEMILRQEGGREYWREALKLLEYARLCRTGGTKESVTFVHRRFQEFFFVESIMEEGGGFEREDYESILRDSSLRDALVLYCEVADDAKAREIAEFCWATIQENAFNVRSIHLPGTIALVNAVYFLADAFRNRKEAMQSFYSDYVALVEVCLDYAEGVDIVVLLALVHGIVLFHPDDLQKTVVKVFSLHNYRLNDVVMQNFRLVQRIDCELLHNVYEYFYSTSVGHVLKSYRSFKYSFHVSKSLRPAHVLLSLAEINSVYYLFSLFLGLVSCIVVLVLSVLQAYSGESIIFFRYFSHFTSTGASQIPTLLSLMLFKLFVHLEERERITQHDSTQFSMFSFTRVSVFYVNITELIMTFPSSFIVFELYSPRASDTFFIISLFIIIILKLSPLLYFFYYTVVTDIENEVLRLRFHSFFYILVVVVLIGVIASLITLLPHTVQDTISIAFISIAGILAIIELVLLAIKAFPYLVWYSVCDMIQYCKDKTWLRSRPLLSKIDRTELKKQLRTLHFDSTRLAYLNSLLRQKVELTGDWSESGIRPGFDNAELNITLAQLDCKSIPSDLPLI